MNKVYNFSKNILKLTVPLTVILGISSCSTYQSAANVESDGVYYNPNTDRTYAQIEAENTPSQNGIKVGSPYFDENGNGAEDFFYGENSTTNGNVNVNVNSYGYAYVPLSQINVSNFESNWGRNDGVNINIYTNPFYNYWGYRNYWSPFGYSGFGLNWGWSNFYHPYNYWNMNYYYGYGSSWAWGMYNNYYGGWYGMNPWMWNRYNSWGYGYYGYYGNRNNSNRVISGSRPSNGLIDPNARPNTLTRPDQGIRNNNRNNTIINSSTVNGTRDTRSVREVRPNQQLNTLPNSANGTRDTRPVREVRPNQQINTQSNSSIRETRPVREVRSNQQINTQPNTGVRQTRPVQSNEQRQNTTNQFERSNQRSTPTYTPAPSINRGSVGTSSGSMGGGSNSGTRGSGRR